MQLEHHRHREQCVIVVETFIVISSGSKTKAQASFFALSIFYFLFANVQRGAIFMWAIQSVKLLHSRSQVGDQQYKMMHTSLHFIASNTPTV